MFSFNIFHAHPKKYEFCLFVLVVFGRDDRQTTTALSTTFVSCVISMPLNAHYLTPANTKRRFSRKNTKPKLLFMCFENLICFLCVYTLVALYLFVLLFCFVLILLYFVWFSFKLTDFSSFHLFRDHHHLSLFQVFDSHSRSIILCCCHRCHY